MGKDIFALLTLGFLGVIIADVLTHPAGTKAAGGSVGGVLRNLESAMLGKPQSK